MGLSAVGSGRVSNAIVALTVVVAPVLSYITVINREVRLVPLSGVDIVCAKCNRKAVRTLPSVAEHLRSNGVYVWERRKYGTTAPAWCEQHGPDKRIENVVPALLGALGTLVFGIAVSSRLRPAGR